jgi:hypothetical protein
MMGLFIVSIADWKLVAAVPINHLSSVSDNDGQVLQLRTTTNHFILHKESPMVHLTAHDLDSIHRLPKCAMGTYTYTSS